MQKLEWEYKTDLEKAGLRVVELLKANGFQAFWVGGVVRDKILKRKTENIDIATDALPDQVVLILSREKIYVKPIGKKFGSILALVGSEPLSRPPSQKATADTLSQREREVRKKYPVEITTFRQEGFYSDNRHPDQVRFIKDFAEDAKRRDFTINAMYFDPITKELFDPMKGILNLEARILKFVGDPKKRIDEDGLRMLRGVRLATQLGFKFEKNSFAAIKTRAKYIQYISGERVKAELDKILLSNNRTNGLELLDNIGLLKFIIPETDKLKKIFHASKTYHLEGSVLIHTLKAVSLLAPECNLSLVYATIFHDIGKIIKPTPLANDLDRRFSYSGHVELSGKIFERFAEKYHFPRKEKMLISWLIKHHDDRMQFRQWDDGTKIQFMLTPDFDLLLELWRVDSLANLRMIGKERSYEVSKAYILAKELLPKVAQAQKLFHLADGKLIMKYSKLKPSPALGQKIDEIKAQIVLGKIKSELDLKKYLA